MNKLHASKFFRFISNKNETEIRVINRNTKELISKGFVKTEEEFLKMCDEYNEKGNVYASINEKGTGTKDDDVTIFKMLSIDVDAVSSEEGKPVSDTELRKCKLKVEEMLIDFEEHGWPKPMIVMSGNGYQLHWKLPGVMKEDIPEFKSHIGAFEDILKMRYSSDVCLVDKICGPSGLMKVPGTMSMKGEPDEGRPRRMAEIVSDGSSEPSQKVQDFILNIPIPKQKYDEEDISEYPASKIHSDQVISYIMENTLPEDLEKNQVLIKNLSMLVERSDLSSEEKRELAKKIMERLKHPISEWEGWANKMRRGGISSFNEAEMNAWINRHQLPIKKYGSAETGKTFILKDVLTRLMEEPMDPAQFAKEYENKVPQIYVTYHKNMVHISREGKSYLSELKKKSAKQFKEKLLDKLMDETKRVEKVPSKNKEEFGYYRIFMKEGMIKLPIDKMHTPQFFVSAYIETFDEVIEFGRQEDGVWRKMKEHWVSIADKVENDEIDKEESMVYEIIDSLKNGKVTDEISKALNAPKMLYYREVDLPNGSMAPAILIHNKNIDAEFKKRKSMVNYNKIREYLDRYLIRGSKQIKHEGNVERFWCFRPSTFGFSHQELIDIFNEGDEKSG